MVAAVTTGTSRMLVVVRQLFEVARPLFCPFEVVNVITVVVGCEESWEVGDIVQRDSDRMIIVGCIV